MFCDQHDRGLFPELLEANVATVGRSHVKGRRLYRARISSMHIASAILLLGAACSSESSSVSAPTSAAGSGTSGSAAGAAAGGTPAVPTGGMSGRTAAAAGGAAGAGLNHGGAGVAAVGGSAGVAAGSGGATQAAGSGGGATAGSGPVGGEGGTSAAGMAGANAGSGGSAGAGSPATPPSCPLPTTFKWSSGAALAQPKNGWVSLKDFTHVVYNGKHLVYMTTHDQANWGSAMFMFDDWPDAASAPQTKTTFGVAPTLFYFTPKKLWILAYQWGRFKFSYRTSADPTDANGWSAEQNLYNAAVPSSGTGPIDQTVICNSAKCYLYYAGDNGHIYESSLPIADFPGQFPTAQDSGIQGTAQNLFEAVQVYAVKGSDQFLMIVEAQGSARYFRAWTARDLEGPWMLLTDAFATKSNVAFSSAWTNDISHGDLIRSNPDETFTIDPCNLQMIFQGRDPSSSGDYGRLPYRPGLLTLVR